MRVLTQQQMGFAGDILNEVPAGRAYMNHYKVKSRAVADVNASRLLRHARMQAYLQHLRDKMEENSIATPKERRKILTEIARGNLLDYQETGADGGYLSIGKESPNTKAIAEITSRTEYDKDGSGAALVTKVKLHNPISAIDILNKMDKLYEDKQSVRDVNIVFVVGKGYSEPVIEGEVADGND